MLVRFSIHQINAPSSYWYLSQSSIAEKRHGAIQKLFIKKREKKSWEKIDKCPRYLKQLVLRCPPQKKKINKIAHVLFQSCFQVSKERCFQGA